MKLYAADMFFRGANEKEKAYDCCIHGKIVFNIGDDRLCDDAEWCVSASAYRFLHAIFENHFTGAGDFLIPCCGHFMIPSDDKKAVMTSGCNNGIDFDIIHERENIIIKTKEKAYTVSFEEFMAAVLSLAKQVEDFYKSNPPRQFENDFDKYGFGAFITEWYSLYDRANELKNYTPQITVITFEDYNLYSEDSITGISEGGISLNSFEFINFKECSYNFCQINGGSGMCVGEHDIKNLSFSFYTSPKPTVVKFTGKHKFPNLPSKQNSISRFRKLQNEIIKQGYTTRDIT